jgi:cell division protein DivIC
LQICTSAYHMKVLSILKNKYLLTGIAFIIFLTFFDDRDLVSNFRHSRELKDLEQSRAHYQQEIAKTRQELKQLRTDAALLEKYAREKYLMKRDNEDLFLVKAPNE